MKNKIGTIYKLCLNSLFQNKKPIYVLVKAELFAVGRIGYAGMIFQEQRIFRNVLLSKRPIKILRKVLVNGTNEAKAYALLGLYFLSPNDYERAKEKFEKNGELVRCMRGRIEYAQTFRQLFKEIESGHFQVGSLESASQLVRFVGGP